MLSRDTERIKIKRNFWRIYWNTFIMGSFTSHTIGFRTHNYVRSIHFHTSKVKIHRTSKT